MSMKCLESSQSVEEGKIPLLLGAIVMIGMKYEL